MGVRAVFGSVAGLKRGSEVKIGVCGPRA